MLDADGNEIVVSDEPQQEAAPEVEAEAPAKDEQFIPKARFDEVLQQRASLAEQMQQAQQQLYETNVSLQKLQASYETEKRIRAETPASQRQNLSPEEQSAADARIQLKQLMSESVEGVIKQRFTDLESRFAPLMQIAEQSERNAFYSHPKVKDLPEPLLNTAEKLYSQYKTVMPGVTREIALMFAKGQMYDANITGATQAASQTASAVSKVNAAASVTKPTTSSQQAASVTNQNKQPKANDLERELLNLANRGYK